MSLQLGGEKPVNPVLKQFTFAVRMCLNEVFATMSVVTLYITVKVQST